MLHATEVRSRAMTDGQAQSTPTGRPFPDPIVADSPSAATHAALGAMYLTLGECEAALEHFLAAHGHSWRTDHLALAAECLLALGRRDDAACLFRRAIELGACDEEIDASLRGGLAAASEDDVLEDPMARFQRLPAPPRRVPCPV
ncbi:MAG: hypothetical protein AAGC60_08455 [Acidobacteriota bacterium]